MSKLHIYAHNSHDILAHIFHRLELVTDDLLLTDFAASSSMLPMLKEGCEVLEYMVAHFSSLPAGTDEISSLLRRACDMADKEQMLSSEVWGLLYEAHEKALEVEVTK